MLGREGEMPVGVVGLMLLALGTWGLLSKGVTFSGCLISRSGGGNGLVELLSGCEMLPIVSGLDS